MTPGRRRAGDRRARRRDATASDGRSLDAVARDATSDPGAGPAVDAGPDVPGRDAGAGGGPDAEPAARSGAGDGTPIGRRIVLGMLGLGAAGIAFGDGVQARIESALRPVTRNDPTGLTSFVPTAGRFRIYSVTGHTPEVSDGDYRLTVDGLVDTPLELGLADLTARPQTELVRDFQCVTGWRVPEVRWKGVRIADLLDEAGVRDGATHLRIWSFDGVYTESLTLDQARRDDVLVAHEMLDGPVSSEHGGPVRLFVGPMYGYKSLKWLERIEVVDLLHPGYWEVRGYDVDAWVGRSNGRSDEPTST